ncbi:hypothetical protein TTHERM_00156720 (macronuclear) [Tetrahymena thermophila SB210]|uniref:Uncharacterized protein n=1 Tax=Tetrahymena thermophila (strain SB210) TaxID=312017 RepID=Q22WG3_TETTS|nr:hypothetical protein TTHERM_00156720 [Tetrahymena thermophila SB210]EAR89454.2 hypothetical protein TTHERM_00156720 [Tetrahymena thermophila SB210]|eukprot:XP_001009699.2 hypothetical protein TTHERM_00156720 [Tetrahymena thermophila SB210]
MQQYIFIAQSIGLATQDQAPCDIININKAREEIHLILTEAFARYSCEKREVLELVFTQTY